MTAEIRHLQKVSFYITQSSMCLMSSELYLMVESFPQFTCLQSFSYLWVLWCTMKWIFGWNIFLQLLNIKVLSPGWILWCVRASLTSHRRPFHKHYTDRFSHLWSHYWTWQMTNSWVFLVFRFSVSHSHVGWIFRCSYRWNFSLKDFPHTFHW